MNIVHVGPALYGIHADLVGRPHILAALHAAARHPDGEAPGIVIAAQAPFVEWGAPEFAAPDDQRILRAGRGLSDPSAGRRLACPTPCTTCCGWFRRSRGRPSRCPSRNRAPRNGRRAPPGGGPAGSFGRRPGSLLRPGRKASWWPPILWKDRPLRGRRSASCTPVRRSGCGRRARNRPACPRSRSRSGASAGPAHLRCSASVMPFGGFKSSSGVSPWRNCMPW